MDHFLIGRGMNGWHSSGISHGNRCSSSGGSLASYLAEAKDGTPVYDAENADYGAFVDWVVKGPMFDPSLAPHEIATFGDDTKKTLLGMLPALGGAFKSLATLSLCGLSSLDYVGLDVYLAGIREKVPGVKIGKVVNHAVVWENHEVEERAP